MTKAKTKLVLNDVRSIPLNKLVASAANVHRIKNGISVEELASDIAHRGLLQNLNVRPVLDDDGEETGSFHVLAGGRRFRALQLLVRQKRIAKTAEIPCKVKDADDPISAEEDSLAENTFHVGLHPLDQFRGMKTLVDHGLGIETVADRFHTTPKTVQQRLKLVAVSPKLLDVYAEGEMMLEQLTAFTVSNDHERQEQVWATVSGQYYDAEPSTIRSMLTEATVESSDRRALFVGVEAYKAAGGTIVADLFAEDDDCYLENPVLLEELCTAKLKTVAESLRPEGWKWIAVAVTFPYGHDSGMRRLCGKLQELTETERAEREALREEFERLEAEYSAADEYPDEVDARLGEIEAALEAFENRPRVYSQNEVTRAGVFIDIDHHGNAHIARGYVRAEDDVREAPIADDEAAEEGGISDTVITVGGAPQGDGDDEPEGLKPLPDRLLGELTAYRTLALQNAVASHPHVAMTALLHTLCLDTFYHGGASSCVNASVRRVYPPVQAAELKESPSAVALGERHDVWKAELPEQQAHLWDHLSGLSEDARLGLLAHCVSLGISALYERGTPGGITSPHMIERRIAEANRLAGAVNLDMVEVGWKPTAANYLGRVPKARILEAVREAKGESAAQLLDHLKKDEMAKEAERLLDGTGWLPEGLRLSDSDAVLSASVDDEALPAFLDGDEEEVVDELDGSDAVAAE
ncbi:MAG TPA: ParB/RepB/Spo0J family partition protein [Bryobacteraceae bacterium]|jgi:ParB family chromosome partitioning protein